MRTGSHEDITIFSNVIIWGTFKYGIVRNGFIDCCFIRQKYWLGIFFLKIWVVKVFEICLTPKGCFVFKRVDKMKWMFWLKRDCIHGFFIFRAVEVIYTSRHVCFNFYNDRCFENCYFYHFKYKFNLFISEITTFFFLSLLSCAE